MVKLNIVIPTLNEEGYLGNLLTSLTQQTFTDFDVTVVDAKSTDKTVAIAGSYEDRLKIKAIIAPHKGVSLQRNLGAKAGEAAAILFLDADVVLHPRYLDNLLKGVKDREVANCWLIPISDKSVDKAMYTLYNLFFLDFGRFIWPVAVGNNIYVTREVFEEIGGFDPEVKVWEDVDFVKRAIAKGARFAVLRKPKIYASVRRFEMRGRINYIKENFKAMQYALRYGEMPSEDRGYYPMGLDYSQLKYKSKASKARLERIKNHYRSYLTKIKKTAEKLNLKELVEDFR